VLVLEPSSCRVVKEQVLYRFEQVPDCRQALVAEPDIPVVQVVHKFLQEQEEVMRGIAPHNTPTVPSSNLQVGLLQVSVDRHLESVRLAQLRQLAQDLRLLLQMVDFLPNRNPAFA